MTDDRFDKADLAHIAFDLSPAGMLAVDAQGLIVTANREAERLFGWKLEELLGRSIETVIPARFHGVHPGHRDRFMREPRSRPMGAGRELFALRRDGSEFPVEIGLNPIETSRGRFVLASIVDITERRKVEEFERRSQRLETLGVLAGGIAHDFNNILMAIVGHTELAVREADLPPPAREDLDRVLSAAKRGRQLVERILTFTRTTEPARVAIRLGPTVEEAIELLRASLPSTLEIRATLDPGTPLVLADDTQILQVLMNLATNSAHAMPSGGVLCVDLLPHEVRDGETSPRSGIQAGAYARLRLSDTGIGMAPDVLEHALEPFYTTRAAGQGTGLGLSVVHGIVTSHGGTIEIDSAEGRGTTITIDLPAAGHVAAAAPVAITERATPECLRILFVEDEPTLATMQQRQLEHLGFHVTVHTSSLEALDDFRSRPEAFELLITDDTMPRMTGSRLAVEALSVRPGLPVLMVSGGHRSDPAHPLPTGVRKILRKPHTVDELEQAIREVMGPQSRDAGPAGT